MKGYCKCGEVIDEVEYSQLGMCLSCHLKAKGNMYVILQELYDDCRDKVKVKSMVVVRGDKEFHYVCTSCKWNYWLNRYYPLAELVMTVEHFKPKCPHGTFGGYMHCMKCRPELMKE